MTDAGAVRSQIASRAPTLARMLGELLPGWTRPIIQNLERRRSHDGFPKTVSDPIWGVIELYPWEVAILDSPLLQRLRGVKQLGFAHAVYPGAVHSRLEHTLGVIEAAARMMRALERNAEHHRSFGKDKDDAVPRISEADRCSTRLAGLLHDIGHGAFSHVTEGYLRQCAPGEFDAITETLRAHYEGVTKVAPSEVLAAMIVLSKEMDSVFLHPHFEAVTQPAELAAAVTGRILGSRTALDAGYLSGVISGPIDADKLDYMARDSHHSGLPVSLDMERLISKLEVVTIRPDNAPSPDLRGRAEAAPSKRIYEMGVSLSGVGAYEQMVIGRVMLYDRLYHHHKIRTAEAMVRRSIEVAREEGAPLLHLRDFMSSVSDEAFLAERAGLMQTKISPAAGPRSARIAGTLLNRQTYHRAYAFAAKFISGLQGLTEDEAKDTKSLLWDTIYRACMESVAKKGLESDIHTVARELRRLLDDGATADDLLSEQVIVDLPANRSVATGNDFLVRTENGDIVLPALYFDPERWSKAYEHQKLLGYVLAPRQHVPLVATAARIVFFDRFSVAMDQEADKAAKTFGVVRPEWLLEAAQAGLCSRECVAALVENRPNLARIRPEHIIIPDQWKTIDSACAQRLADAFDNAIPAGVPASIHAAVLLAIESLAAFVDFSAKEGSWSAAKGLTEKEMQAEIRRFLRSRELSIAEGSEFGGGETDLLLSGSIVIENKVRGTTADPFETGQNYDWQARRYSISVVSQVSFVVVAYRPSSEAAILPLPERIRIQDQSSAPNHAFVRVVVPWGQGVPSAARRPG